MKAIPSKNAIVHKDVSGKSDNEENWSCTLVVKSSKLETIQDEYKEGVKAKDVVDIDANDHENPFACAEYAEQICVYLKKREVTVLFCSKSVHTYELNFPSSSAIQYSLCFSFRLNTKCLQITWNSSKK